MTKMNFNFTSIVVLLVMLVPTFAWAQGTTTTSIKDERGVCLRLVTIENTMTSRLIEADRLYTLSVAQRLQAVANRRSQSGLEMQEAGNQSDAHLTQFITAQEERAVSSEQKAAVKTFAKDAHTITVAYRSALRDAEDTFWNGVRLLISERTQHIETESKSFVADIQQAIASAKSSCAAGTDPKEVRDTLHQNLAALQATHTQAIAALPSLTDRIRALSQARLESVLAANSRFTGAIDAAVQKLWSVLQ